MSRRTIRFLLIVPEETVVFGSRIRQICRIHRIRQLRSSLDGNAC
jgi:hypothetical protein